MNNFVKGMGSLNMFPRWGTAKTKPEAAWEAVWDAFRQTGDYMRSAMIELDAQIQSEKAAYGQRTT